MLYQSLLFSVSYISFLLKLNYQFVQQFSFVETCHRRNYILLCNILRTIRVPAYYIRCRKPCQIRRIPGIKNTTNLRLKFPQLHFQPNLSVSWCLLVCGFFFCELLTVRLLGCFYFLLSFIFSFNFSSPELFSLSFCRGQKSIPPLSKLL